MAADSIIKLCSNDDTITKELAKNHTHEVDSIVSSLVKSWKAIEKGAGKDAPNQDEKERLDRAAQCGKFPYRPSDLFLKIYSEVLDTLHHDPLANLVSPSLIGASGTIPLSIVSVIPDIMRHYADLIVNAKHEVFLATNYWENSHSAGIVSDSLRELSKRCAQDKRTVVVKLMYDRGTPSQMIKNHADVPPKAWEAPEVGLPNEKELANISLQVVNYHRPPLGTFHAKYMVVDRRVACLNSNNIQDRPNVEMMVHLEGPIVESFYDMALVSWANALNPPLPLVGEPPSYEGAQYKFERDNEHLKYIDSQYTGEASRKLLQQQHQVPQPSASDGNQKDHGGAANAVKAAAGKNTGGGGDLGKDDLIGAHPAMNVPHRSQEVLANERDGEGNADTAPPEDQSKSSRPDENTDGGAGPEVLKTDGASSQNRVNRITEHLNASTLNAKGGATDDDSMDDFKPHILHSSHNPVPIAMVNRKPKGTPGHEGAHLVPQDVAWLAAFKYAQKSIFIQTPTFNASPVIPATLDACRRGVEVTLYLDLGFNDLGEMIPFQGGTNEVVVHQMYETLNKEGKQDNLKVYWYTAKDQIVPMSATVKQRNCHVKFMSVDDQIAIVGNGNQDTQSWFHSQEINVLVDSPQLVHEWYQGINANQNTMRYGRVSDKDGVWRDKDGKVVESSGTKTTGVLGGLKGVSGAIKRVRGTGGF